MTIEFQAGLTVSGDDHHFLAIVHDALNMLGNDPAHDALIIHGASARAIEGLFEAQGRAEAAGARFLPVIWTADELQVGPMVITGRPGCLGCFRRWTLDRWARDVARAFVPAPWPDHWPAPFQIATGAAIIGETGRCDPAAAADILVMTSDSSRSTRHRLLPHPDCERCSFREEDTPTRLETLFEALPPSSNSSYRALDISAAGPAMERDFVDGRCGLVRAMVEETRSVALPMTFARLSSDRNRTDVQLGVGRTGFRAMDRAVAVAEAVERFAGFRPRLLDTMVHARLDALGDAAVDPRSFILHDPIQRHEPGFAWDAYDEKAIYGWVWAYSFRQGRARLVPEQLVYYALPPPPDGHGGRYVFETSNGCATGGSLAEATLHGLMELVERDAFLVSWYGQRPRSRVDMRGIGDPLVEALLARLDAEGISVDLLDIASGIDLAAFAAVGTQSMPGRPALSLAAGAHRDPVKAAQGALVELATSVIERAGDTDARTARGRLLLQRPELVQSMDDHQTQCWPPEALTERAFPIAADPIEWSDIECRAPPAHEPVEVTSALHALIGSALTVCDDVLVIDQSFPAATVHGLRTVKVLAPGLLPMTFGNQYRRLSIDRLLRAGVEPARCDLAAFARRPHGFP